MIYWFFFYKDIYFRHFCLSDLIITGVLLLHNFPRLSIIAVSDFKHWDKLHHPKVLGPLSDDAREALCLLQINLLKTKEKPFHSPTL